MPEANIVLTDTDREILASYCVMLDKLSTYLGSAYEIILHSLEDYDHSAIKVINGFHTGRAEGAPITNLALEKLESFREHGWEEADLTYFSRNRDGEPLKSTTIPVIGEGDRIIGLLCINFYLNTPLTDLVAGFIDQRGAASPVSETGEYFSSNSSEMLEDLIARERHAVFLDEQVSSAGRNREIIRRLNARGVFSMKDAVATTARMLGISKNTVYLHLRTAEQRETANN